MNRKYFLSLVILTASIFLADCSLPRVSITEATQTPAPVTVTPADTAAPTLPTAELGLVENPLILALPPTANSQEQVEAARLIADQFTQRTGYVVVTIVPDSYAALVDALEKGNAHIALLDPYAYALAYKKDLVKAAYAVLEDSDDKYGAQFIAARKGGFKSYFNPLTGMNTADAREALLQFTDKKPCWSDESSPSGYVVPAGYLNANQIVTRPAAFVEGHPTVVRSIYASGICDFGGTYIDARKFPSLENEFPDLMEQVIVVWRIPEIIPYDVLALSSKMPQGMRNLFTDQVAALMQTDAGSAAFKTVYNIDELQAVNDAYYDEFRTYVDASGVDLSSLVK